jgi:hypothetical protein
MRRPLLLASLLVGRLSFAQDGQAPTEPAPTEPAAAQPISTEPTPKASETAVDATKDLDIEDRKSALDEQEKKLETHVFFETEWHEFDNIDLRPLDESTDQAILDSDDRNGFAFTGISLELGYQVDPSTRLVVGTSYRGLWGNDQIGNVNRFGGFLYFTGLYVEYTPKKWKYQPTFRVGRQRFDIGGMGGAREFILGDIVDQLRIDFPLGKIGTLITIPVNVIGLSAENDDVNFIGFVGQANTGVFGFRGDRMTRRHGAILAINPEALPALDVRAYGFYTHLGAAGSGSDISYQGRLGNFADKDWVFNTGLRASYTIADLVTPFAAFDASVGIDRKERVTYDVDTIGFSWTAGATLRKEKQGKTGWGVDAELRYFEAQGPAYDADGLQYSHGYVGMKARQVGGLVANRFLGWHPTAYVGAWGVEDTPQETDRKSGMRVISLDGSVAFPGPVSVSAGYWFMQDTGLSLVNQARVDDIEPPYGYSREEFRAQGRLGKLLGHEVDLGVGIRLSKHLDLNLQGGVMLPGAYYQQVIARVAGTALGSNDAQPAWDASGGVRLNF